MRTQFQRLIFLGLMAATCTVAADEPDVKGLIGKLKSSKVTARREAAKGLAELGKKAKPAVPELTIALGDEDPEVRYLAVGTLGEIGPDAKSAAKAMAEKFDDDVYDVRRLAIDAFPKLGPDVLPVLIEAIKSESYRVRINATMSAMGFEKDLVPAVDALIDSLNDEVWMVRQNAAGSLIYAGTKAKNAIPKLLDRARNDDNVHVRHNAIDTLFELHAEADDLLPLALAAMKDPKAYPKTRFVATAKLDSLGVKARAAVPVLIDLLKSDKDPAIRMHAALNLLDIGAEPDEILEPLIKGLSDRDADVQIGVAHALRRLGPKAAPAVPAIRTRLAALGNRAKPKLVHWDQDCRLTLIETLGAIGTESLPAVPELIVVLENSQPAIRAAAARVLGTLGKEAASAVPALEKLVKDKEAKVREAAEEALKSIGTGE